MSCLTHTHREAAIELGEHVEVEFPFARGPVDLPFILSSAGTDLELEEVSSEHRIFSPGSMENATIAFFRETKNPAKPSGQMLEKLRLARFCVLDENNKVVLLNVRHVGNKLFFLRTNFYAELVCLVTDRH